MFKKMRDKIAEATQQATQQATARGEQEFHAHAAQFQQQAAAQGYDIRPQLPTLGMATQAMQGIAEDPAMAQFMSLPGEEQIRQQREANLYGQNLRRLYENGEPATVVIRTLEPTGVTLVGQQQYRSTLEVSRADGTTYQTTVTHLVPSMTYAQYAPGTKHDARIDPADPTAVGVFGLLD